jgi:hypothetical protein
MCVFLVSSFPTLSAVSSLLRMEHSCRRKLKNICPPLFPQPWAQISIALDCASSELFDEGDRKGYKFWKSNPDKLSVPMR